VQFQANRLQTGAGQNRGSVSASISRAKLFAFKNMIIHAEFVDVYQEFLCNTTR
jgi:hypothetical protein